MNKVLVHDNLTVKRRTHKVKTGLYLTRYEKREILKELDDSNCFVLYDYFATAPLKSALEVDDIYIGKQLNWSTVKVRRIKAELEQAEYLTFDEAVRKSDSMILSIAYVGKMYHMLIKANLPRNILNSPALTKLLKLFPLNDPMLNQTEKDTMVDEMNDYYKNNIEEFI